MKAGKARSTYHAARMGVAEMKDIRVPTIICPHNERWSTVLTKYCKRVLGLAEAAVKHVVQSCEPQANLYKSSPVPSVCYRHVEACGTSIALEYEVLQLTVHIDSDSEHMFEPLLTDPAAGFRTSEERVAVSGFARLQAMGTVRRQWQWMSQNDLMLMKAKGLHVPKDAMNLDVLSESLSIHSLLIGVESCAPLKEDAFGHAHGIDAVTKELSAFGKRKWRDFRTGGQAVPADIGGMRVVVNTEKFEFLKKVCADLALCQPSECFEQDTEPKEEMATYQTLLQSNDCDFSSFDKNRGHEQAPQVQQRPSANESPVQETQV